MFKRAKYVLQFSRRDDLQITGFDLAIEIVESFGPVFLKLWKAGQPPMQTFSGLSAWEGRSKEKFERKHFIELAISHCYMFQVVPTNN